MYTRVFTPPNRSYFLFGPRGTGKSTWLKNHYRDAYHIDLLPSKSYLRFQKNPSDLIDLVQVLPKDQWIILDEIQKVPELLDEVHSLIETHGHKKFVLTGSSARKLKQKSTNLLAGRAFVRYFFTLTSRELDFSIRPDQIIQYGLLPLSVTAGSQTEREEFLESYLNTYLAEEIKNEGFVRNIGSFSRFLEIAALVAGKTISLSGLSRDSGIGRDTVRAYFSIFEDTLIGSWLPAYRPRAKIKEVASPKFYWFDPGVLNVASGGLKQPMPLDWRGVLFEHWIFHELRTYLNYSAKKGSLGYWGTPNESEIDFVYWYGDSIVGIEAKASEQVRSDYFKGFRSFEETRKLKSSWIVYLGTDERKHENTWILPIYSFLKRLWQGEII